MTEAVHARPLVRPRFLRWSIVIFVLLLPFAAHALWDYLESARLAGNIAAVRQNGEPVSVYQINPSPRAVDGEEAEAERLYLAAADLVRPDSSRPVRMPVRIEAAERTGEWPGDLVSQIRAHVRQHDDAFRLLDRAAPLAHPGFAASKYRDRTGSMLGLAYVAGLRTLLLALERRGDEAANSAYSELRIGRTLEPLWRMMFARRAVGRLVTLIENAVPRPESWPRVESALAEIDRDDLLRQHLLLERATLLDNMTSGARQSVPEWIVRPLFYHSINRRLELLTFQIEAANRGRASSMRESSSTQRRTPPGRVLTKAGLK